MEMMEMTSHISYIDIARRMPRVDYRSLDQIVIPYRNKLDILNNAADFFENQLKESRDTDTNPVVKALTENEIELIRNRGCLR